MEIASRWTCFKVRQKHGKVGAFFLSLSLSHKKAYLDMQRINKCEDACRESPRYVA